VSVQRAIREANGVKPAFSRPVRRAFGKPARVICQVEIRSDLGTLESCLRFKIFFAQGWASCFWSFSPYLPT